MVIIKYWLYSLCCAVQCILVAYLFINLKKIIYFIYFIFGCGGSSLLHAGFSLVVASGGSSSLRCAGFSLRWLLLLRSPGFRLSGFSSCGTWAQQLWSMGLISPQHVGSFRTRAQTRVPCIGRWIFNHCATREAPTVFILKSILSPMNVATPAFF